MKRSASLKRLSGIIIAAVLLLQSFAFAASMVMPSGLETIGESSFEGDSSITHVVIGTETKEIGSRAFANTGLEELVIPDSVTRIEADAFDGCGSIRFFVESGSYADSRIAELLRDGSAQGSLCVNLRLGTRDISLSAGVHRRMAFTAESTGVYHFFSKNADSALRAILYDDADEPLARVDSGDDDFWIHQQLAAGQRVFLDISYASASAAGSFELAAEREGQPISVGSNTIPVNAGETVRVQMTAFSSGYYTFRTIGSEDTMASLYDAAGRLICANDDGNDGGNFSIERHLDVGDVVYLDVEYFSDAYAGAMNVVVGEIPDLVLGENTISVSAGEIVRRRFTAPRTGLFAFYSTGSDDTYAYLYDASEKLLASNDDNQSDRNFYISSQLTVGDVVYLDVKYYSSTYAGEMNVVVEERVMPTLSIGANAITVNAGETVRTRFTAPSDGIYYFYSNCADAGSNTYGGLYSASGELILLNDDSGENYNFFIAEELTAGDVVYLDVRYTSSYASGTVPVKVDFIEPEAPTSVTYRALLIGQEGFDPICTRNRGDVELMKSMLRTVNGGRYQITTGYDLNKTQVRSAITSAFAGADSDDVSLFFYASHGITSTGYYYGALATYNGDYILTSEITDWLADIEGKVIVICGTCGSGALISNKNGEAAEAFDPVGFNEALIKAFAAADPGVTVKNSAANSAEMRQSKFYVLTAAAAGESSWGSESYRYNFFPKWLTDGVGTRGVMPADTDQNGETTLHELYTYIHVLDEKTKFNGEYQQHTQVYPENSSFVMFTR